MFLVVRLLAILAVMILGCTGSACAQDSSTSKALDALDKALSQDSRKEIEESKPQTVSAYFATENGIFDITGISLGMTCEQVQAVFGSFKQGNCNDCNQQIACKTVSRVNVDTLEFYCFMDFDYSSRLEAISLSRGFRNDKYSADMETANEFFNRYSDILCKKYGKPHIVKGSKMEVVHCWIVNGKEFYLSTDNDEDVSVLYGKK